MARNLFLLQARHLQLIRSGSSLPSVLYPSLTSHLRSSGTYYHTLISTATTPPPQPSQLFRQLSTLKPFPSFIAAYLFSLHSTSFSSSAGSSSSVVLVSSEQEFNNALNKAQDESLPAIFYFTASWCGPCRLISPVIGELSEKFPNVTTYKIDIDEEGIQGTLGKLQITSVPTLHFFQNGKKAAEMIGADVARLRNTVENLYK